MPFDLDKLVQLVLDPGVVPEVEADAVGRFGAAGRRPGDELFPSARLRRHVSGAQGAGDRYDVRLVAGGQRVCGHGAVSLVILARSVTAMVVKVGLMSMPVPESAGRPLLSIGALAKRSGKTAATIRYYEQIGLLTAPGRVGGKRMYDTDAVRRLAVISTGQRAGLTLGEIKALLSASPGDPEAIGQLRKMAQRKLPEIITLIERTELVRSWLTSAARCECPDLDQCPLFDDPELPPHHAGPPTARKQGPGASRLRSRRRLRLSTLAPSHLKWN